MEELIKRLERVIQTGAPDKDGQHPITAEVVDDYHYCRDGEKKDDDVTCENCDYSEKFVDGLILCRRTKTSHRVSATSTCGKGKREVEDAEAKI